MGSSEKAQRERKVVRQLALDENTASDWAYCISSYGAFQAVSSLSAQKIREVFCDSTPEDLKRLADSVEETYKDLAADPETHEGAIKDLAYKEAVLRNMAEENIEDKV